MPTRVPFQTQARAGAVTLLTDYGQSAGLRLQVYKARPMSINPPCAFVDRMTETLSDFTLGTRQRVPTAEVLVVHGLFDSADAADQRDEFVDGFLDWVADRWHAWGVNTLVAGVSVEDEPNYVPDWMPPERQRSYYATRITLEGLAAT